VHQIRFRPGLRPDRAGRAYSALPDPLAGLRGVLLLRGDRAGEGKEQDREKGRGKKREVKGKKGVGRGGRGKGKRGNGREGEEGRKVKTPPPSIPAYAPAHPRMAGIYFCKLD